RPPAPLPQFLDPLTFPIPIQPKVARLTRDPKLAAQPGHLLFSTACSHDKSQSLLVHLYILPRHSQSPSRRALASPYCQGCPENDVSRMSWNCTPPGLPRRAQLGRRCRGPPACAPQKGKGSK